MVYFLVETAFEGSLALPNIPRIIYHLANFIRIYNNSTNVVKLEHKETKFKEFAKEPYCLWCIRHGKWCLKICNDGSSDTHPTIPHF